MQVKLNLNRAGRVLFYNGSGREYLHLLVLYFGLNASKTVFEANKRRECSYLDSDNSSAENISQKEFMKAEN